MLPILSCSIFLSPCVCVLAIAWPMKALFTQSAQNMTRSNAPFVRRVNWMESRSEYLSYTYNIQTCLIKQSTIESFQTPNAIYVSTCVWHTAFCIHVSFSCCFFHFFFFFFGPVLYAANLNLTYSCENDFNLFIVGAFVAEIRAQL